MAAVLDIEKTFVTTWHHDLLHKPSKLQFSACIIKLIGSLHSNRKFIVTVEGEMFTPREIQAGAPQGSVLALSLYSVYINDTPQTLGVHLALIADEACAYTADPKEVMSSGSFNAASLQWGHGFSSGT
jgi:hypothetical protein